MNNPLEAVVDIDGVLADFEGHFCEIFGSANRHVVNLQQRYPYLKSNVVSSFVQDRETYKYLDPIQVGLDIVGWLNKQGVVVHIVSSRPVGTFALTRKWLQDFCVPYSSLTVKTDKVHTIKSLNPALVVDDIIGVVEDCHRVGIQGILVKHPWNETSFFPRIETIEEFICAFERLVETDARFSSAFQSW